MTLKPIEKAIALSEVKRFRKMFELHEEDRQDYAKQGYRNHYCVHGTNLWTDYDNICGPCEDGYGSWDYQLFAELAIQNAREAVRHAHKIYQEANEVAKLATTKGMTEEGKYALIRVSEEMVEEGTKYLEKYLPKKK